jgi:serine/threonine protein kinase
MLIEGQEILEGRFKIIKKLGSGAFGEIFKGTQNLLQIH